MKILRFLCTFAKAESDLGILQVQHGKSLGGYLVQLFSYMLYIMNSCGFKQFADYSYSRSLR